MIYVLGNNETIIDILEPNKERSYYNDLHVQDLKEGSETFDFSTDVNIEPNSTIVFRTTTGELHPFIVQRIQQNASITRSKTYYCDAEFLELRYTRILEPQTLSGQTAETALQFGLQGTRWELGMVEGQAAKDIEINEYMNVLKYVRMVASEFDLEMRFRVEFNNNTIAARYVDLVERAGLDMGKEIIFGKDLQSIERVEDTSAIVTALYAVGPADDTGHYMSIESVNGGQKYVSDQDALQRWGKDGEHRFDIFSPSIDTKYLTPAMLLDLAKEELAKRINSVVTYNIDAVDLYDVLGMEYERVNLADTVRIKDEGFSPALYVEARVIKIERSYTNPSQNKYTLGDYREIDINNYQSIRRIQAVLNNSKETWNSVTSKVDQSDFTSEKIVEIINDPEATAQIIANKVKIVGAVEVLSDITGNLGSITAGYIDGVIVTGSSFQTKTSQYDDSIVVLEDGTVIAFDPSATIPPTTLVNSQGVYLGTGHGTQAYNWYLKLDNSGGISNPDGGNLHLRDNTDIAGTLEVSNRVYADGGLSVSGGSLTTSDGAGFNGTTYFHGQVYTSQSETGFCGVGGISPLTWADSAVAGQGVNFRMKKNYTPSSVSLSASSNTRPGLVTNITSDGFWLYVTSDGAQNSYCYWRGYYTC